jgi:isopenicillin-N epimerase
LPDSRARIKTCDRVVVLERAMMNDRDLARHWVLDPSIVYLNHGSFGACPRVVLERQAELHARLESEPVRFYVREGEALLDAARERLARFVGADPDDLVPVTNATTGVNAVLQSLTFAPGDELLTTSHAYGACRNALDHVASRAGARVVVAKVPFPTAASEAVVEAVLSEVTPRTRLALLDHVTSPTGLVFPIHRLVSELQGRGVDCLVDGAHAPGMVPLDLRTLGAAYFTGNCHKWLCAPKGAGFLHVRRDRQDGIHSLPISHGYTSRRRARPRIHDEFDWVGTGDPTPFFCVPDALDFMAKLLPGGWEEARRRNRELALVGRALIAEALGVDSLPCPEDMIGSLAAVPLPSLRPPAETIWALATDPIQDLLWERHVEVPVYAWPKPPHRLIRISAQLYNTTEHYATLAAALREIALERG